MYLYSTRKRGLTEKFLYGMSIDSIDQGLKPNYHKQWKKTGTPPRWKTVIVSGSDVELNRSFGKRLTIMVYFLLWIKICWKESCTRRIEIFQKQTRLREIWKAKLIHFCASVTHIVPITEKKG